MAHSLWFVLTTSNALNHIKETSELEIDDPEWQRTDIRIMLWIYTMIDDGLLDL